MAWPIYESGVKEWSYGTCASMFPYEIFVTAKLVIFPYEIVMTTAHVE